MLTEFGPEVAAAIGEAYDHLNRTLCHLLGINPDALDELSDHIDRTIGGAE